MRRRGCCGSAFPVTGYAAGSPAHLERRRGRCLASNHPAEGAGCQITQNWLAPGVSTRPSGLRTPRTSGWKFCAGRRRTAARRGRRGARAQRLNGVGRCLQWGSAGGLGSARCGGSGAGGAAPVRLAPEQYTRFAATVSPNGPVSGPPTDRAPTCLQHPKPLPFVTGRHLTRASSPVAHREVLGFVGRFVHARDYRFAAGRRMVNAAPCPGFPHASIVPPCPVMTSWASARPSPNRR